MKRGESSTVKVRRKRTGSVGSGSKRSVISETKQTPNNSAVQLEQQIKSEDVLPVKVGEELDKILADERSPPMIEDHLRTIFRSAILDHLIVGWESEPCMRNVYAKPPPPVSELSSPDLSTDLSSIMAFTSEARLSQQEMHAKKRRKGRKSQESALSITQQQGSLEKRRKSKKASGLVQESQPAVTEPLAQKIGDFPTIMEGTPLKEPTAPSKDAELVTSSTVGEGVQLPKSSASKDIVSVSKENIGSSKSSEQVVQWDPPHFPDENVNVTFINGNQYVGRVSRKLMEGEGHYIWNDGRSYKGEFVDGKMTGRGHFEWPDLNMYCGDMICGWRHGKGSFVFYDVNVAYEGDWFWGLKHGNGISLYNWDLNDWYWGEWKNDLYDGFGKRHYPNGAFYIGDWRLSVRHGTGSQMWPNSDLYRGGWRFGYMNGYGEYIWSLSLNRGFSLNPGTFYRGSFLDGMRHGLGELHVGNCSSISGLWVNDIKQGLATVLAGNGKVITGDPLFLDDRALPKDRPSMEPQQNASRTTVRRNSNEIVKFTRKGTKPFCRSTIEVLNQPEVGEQHFHKWANDIPLRLPDHEIELEYHINRLRAYKYVKVASSMQTEGLSTVVPFIDMPEYFSDEEDAAELGKSLEQKVSDHSKGSKHGRTMKDKNKKPLEPKDSSSVTQSGYKQLDPVKSKQKKSLVKETRLTSPPEGAEVRKGVKKLPPLKDSPTNLTSTPAAEKKEKTSEKSAIPRDDGGSIGQKNLLGSSAETILSVKQPCPEFGTQTPAPWYVTSEDKILDSELQTQGRRIRRKISGHSSWPSNGPMFPSAYKVRDFDNMREEEFEVKWIRKVILHHLTSLRKIYDKYTNLGCVTPGDAKPLMPRMALWLLYRDCRFHKRGLSMNDIDDMQAERPNSGVEMPHCPMERVYFWQFLHGLLDISWVLYARQGIHGRLDRGTLASALDKLIVDDVIPNTLQEPHESVFLENVDLVPLDDAYALYCTQPQPYTARCFLTNIFPKSWTNMEPEFRSFPVEAMDGHNIFSLGEVPIYIPGDAPLLDREVCQLSARLASLSGIGPKGVVEVLAKECPAIVEDGLIVNMDYPLSFVEWYEVVVMCAKAGLNKEKAFYEKRLAEEERRRELLALEEERLLAQSQISVRSVTRSKKSMSRPLGSMSRPLGYSRTGASVHSYATIRQNKPGNRN